MRKALHVITLLLGGIGLFLQGCEDQCQRTVTYTRYEPIYMSYEELRSSVQSESPRELEQPGKIYFKTIYIFVSEVNEGIHVIDNSDPANPQTISFIRVPGNRDIAVKGNILYADSYVDLVAIDISDPRNVSEVSRVENTFPYFSSASTMSWLGDPAEGVVRDWEEREVTETIDCSSSYGGGIWMAEDLANGSGGGTFSPVTTGGGSEVSPGVGGSMARFTIYQDFLYAISDQDMMLYNISNLESPSLSNTINIGWGIETIFPYEDKLFIGSTTGMFIYDNSTPSNPTQLSQFAHVRSCDPVVVEGNTAYVTLRSGTPCEGFTNQLDVLDITDLTNPILTATHQMTNPHGLGIDDGTLFICDGADGLKVYDANDPLTISNNQLAHFANINTYDVIPLNGLLFMIGPDGLYQYDYHDANNISLLSKIPVIQ